MSRQIIACAMLGSALLAGAAGAAMADETRVQHREWMRKFDNPGGSMNGLIVPKDATLYRVDLHACGFDDKQTQEKASKAC